jgi:hypothetical protein
MNVLHVVALLTLSNTPADSIDRVITAFRILSRRTVLDGLLRIEIRSYRGTEKTGRGFEKVTVTIKGRFRGSKRAGSARSSDRQGGPKAKPGIIIQFLHENSVLSTGHDFSAFSEEIRVQLLPHPWGIHDDVASTFLSFSAIYPPVKLIDNFRKPKYV